MIKKIIAAHINLYRPASNTIVTSFAH